MDNKPVLNEAHLENIIFKMQTSQEKNKVIKSDEKFKGPFVT
jgi:hypothetical protein